MARMRFSAKPGTHVEFATHEGKVRKVTSQMICDTTQQMVADFNALRELLGRYSGKWDRFAYDGCTGDEHAASHFHHFMGNTLNSELLGTSRRLSYYKPLDEEKENLHAFVDRVEHNKDRFALLRAQIEQPTEKNAMPPDARKQALALLDRLEAYTLALSESIKARYPAR